MNVSSQDNGIDNGAVSGHYDIGNHQLSIFMAIIIGAPAVFSALWQKEWLLLIVSVVVLVVVDGLFEIFLPQVRARDGKDGCITR